MPATPTIPVPSSARLEGSGVTETGDAENWTGTVLLKLVLSVTNA